MALNEHNRRKFVAGMIRRIAKLRDQSEQSLDFAIETRVTITKLGPGMVTTKNQINAMLTMADKYSI